MSTSVESRFAGPTGARKVLQIHPTRRCNLRCLHCYSESGPLERQSLAIEVLETVVTDAAAEGYTVLGVSGGEPVLYDPLPELLAHARSEGMVTTVTSNGILLRPKLLQRIREHTSLLAISVDGVPRSHNEMRGARHAFEFMARRLDAVRNSGIPFGFIFTLTQHNVHELQWVLNFAVQEGAGLLQIHPLEPAGRAVEMLPGAKPDALEMAVAYIEAFRAQQMVGDTLRVHIDLAEASLLRAEPARGFADEPPEDVTNTRLADLVTPLVVQADGWVVPFAYGFPRRYAIGNLHEAPLAALTATWRKDRYLPLRQVCRRAFERIVGSAGSAPIANWYEAIVAAAAELDPAAPDGGYRATFGVPLTRIQPPLSA